jgi:hypothetical protein
MVLAVGAFLASALAGDSLLQAEEPVPDPDAELLEAQAEAAAGVRKYRRRQGRPISLGSSGGNVFDFRIEGGFIFCCSGTLGALVEKNDSLFILSNNHVLAATNLGDAGDPVGQPGMLDTQCETPGADTVAHLSQFKKLKFGTRKRNKVDAALAEVSDGAVKTNGKIIKIGIPGDSAIEPEIGMAVKKSGRTTGHTRGTILDVNVTINVVYERTCGSDSTRTARFKNQFVVLGNSRNFSDGGDSGAVIYEDVRDCPRAVGLLFAGAEEFTFANPMQTVLNVMAKRRPRGPVHLVGCSSSAGASAERGLLSQGDLLVQAAMATQERHEEAVLIGSRSRSRASGWRPWRPARSRPSDAGISKRGLSPRSDRCHLQCHPPSPTTGPVISARPSAGSRSVSRTAGSSTFAATRRTL